MTKLSYNQRTTRRPELPKGVCYELGLRDRVRFMATLTVARTTYRSGPYDDVRDAERAYAELKRLHQSA